MNGISKNTYEKMDTDSKLNVLFDYASASHQCVQSQDERIEALNHKFDRRKRIDTAVSGISGFVGGAVVVFIKWVTGK